MMRLITVGSHLHPVRQTLLHTDHQRRRRQLQRRIDEQRIVKPCPEISASDLLTAEGVTFIRFAV